MRTIKLRTDYGAWRIEDRNIEGSAANADTFFIHPDDPLSARLVTEYTWSMKSGPADTSGFARTELTADAKSFHLTWRIEAREAEKAAGKDARRAGHDAKEAGAGDRSKRILDEDYGK